jgi:hypothetical protein
MTAILRESFKSFCFVLFCFLLLLGFGVTGVTQGVTFVRQELYHLNHTSGLEKIFKKQGTFITRRYKKLIS